MEDKIQASCSTFETDKYYFYYYNSNKVDRPTPTSYVPSGNYSSLLLTVPVHHAEGRMSYDFCIKQVNLLQNLPHQITNSLFLVKKQSTTARIPILVGLYKTGNTTSVCIPLSEPHSSTFLYISSSLLPVSIPT
jgi:hypothetical protein